MTQPPKNTPQHWDAYWGGQGAPGEGPRAAAVTGDAPGDKFDALWREFFAAEAASRPMFRLADLACGAGVVLSRAVDFAKSHHCERAFFCGVDYSRHAASKIALRSSAPLLLAQGVTASVSALPFPDRSFNLVVSQFGIEYAGVNAFSEAARILAPGGAAQFIIHYKGGGIDRECKENSTVLESILTSGLFESAKSVFTGDDAAKADHQTSEIFTVLKPELQGKTSGAKALLARLINDISRLLSRRAAFHPKEAVAWIEATQAEVRQYHARMQAMNAAALGQSDLKKALDMISAQAVAADEPEALTIGNKPLPAAWRLKLRRRAL